MPTQHDFENAVRADFANGAWSEAHRARCARSYVANVQQYHFELLLREHFDRVEWNEQLDFTEGIDVAVQHNSQWFGFAVHIQTQRADRFLSRKRDRYRPTMPVLDVLIIPRRYQVGRFWLYHPFDIDEINAFTETTR